MYHRKCGRVVCNSCSPHRITIPHQYIVQPPGTPRVLAPRFPSALGGESSFTDFSVLGGGERVRLCNPCVPDPNTAPPQTQAGHARSQSNLFNAPLPDTGERPTSTTRWSSYLGGMTSTNDPQSRTRSVTMVSLVLESLDLCWLYMCQSSIFFEFSSPGKN